MSSHRGAELIPGKDSRAGYPDRALLSTRLAGAHVQHPAKLPDPASRRHDLPLHDRPLVRRLGARAHREHRCRRRRPGAPRTGAASPDRQVLTPASVPVHRPPSELHQRIAGESGFELSTRRGSLRGAFGPSAGSNRTSRRPGDRARSASASGSEEGGRAGAWLRRHREFTTDGLLPILESHGRRRRELDWLMVDLPTRRSGRVRERVESGAHGFVFPDRACSAGPKPPRPERVSAGSS